MDIRNEIAKRVDALPLEMQEEVLQFTVSLADSRPKGARGAMLRRFSGSLDAASARQMTEAIEEACERLPLRY